MSSEFCYILMNLIANTVLEARKDELTPLDAHNSWLMHDVDQKKPGFEVSSLHSRGRSNNGYDYVPGRDDSMGPMASKGAHMGYSDHDRQRSSSPDDFAHFNRQPVLPDLEYKGRGIAM